MIGDASGATPDNPLGIPGLGGSVIIPTIPPGFIPGLNPQPMPPGPMPNAAGSPLAAAANQAYATADASQQSMIYGYVTTNGAGKGTFMRDRGIAAAVGFALGAAVLWLAKR